MMDTSIVGPLWVEHRFFEGRARYQVLGDKS